MNGLKQAARRESAGNRAVAHLWERYAGHRARLTGEIVRLGGGRLALLGAGNCLDVDLTVLCERFDEVHLIDLDGAALDRAVARQRPDVRARLRRHGGIELSGMLGKTRPLVELAGEVDVVASCCVLTQLAWSAARVHGDGDALTRGIAAFHLRTMRDLLRPGGQALLVTELTSSDDYPLEELGAPPLEQLLATGNHYSIANPLLLRRTLRELRVNDVTSLEPWSWSAAQERTYLVYGLAFSRGE